MGQEEISSLEHWRRNKQAAEAGELKCDPDRMADMMHGCEAWLQQLRESRKHARSAETVGGIGGFPVAEILANKYNAKAREMQQLIDEHIQLVKLMKDTIELGIRNYVEMEHQTQQSLNRIEGSM